MINTHSNNNNDKKIILVKIKVHVYANKRGMLELSRESVWPELASSTGSVLLFVSTSLSPVVRGPRRAFPRIHACAVIAVREFSLLLYHECPSSCHTSLYRTLPHALGYERRDPYSFSRVKKDVRWSWSCFLRLLSEMFWCWKFIGFSTNNSWAIFKYTWVINFRNFSFITFGSIFNVLLYSYNQLLIYLFSTIFLLF